MNECDRADKINDLLQLLRDAMIDQPTLNISDVLYEAVRFHQPAGQHSGKRTNSFFLESLTKYNAARRYTNSTVKNSK